MSLSQNGIISLPRLVYYYHSSFIMNAIDMCSMYYVLVLILVLGLVLGLK